MSRGEFTSLVVRRDAVLAINPVSCELVRVVRDTGSLMAALDLRAVDPTLHLACTAPVPADPASGDITTLGETHDWPLGLWDVGQEVVIMVRRAGHAGWTLVAVDRAGCLGRRRDLPRSSVPVGMNDTWAVIGREDLNEPGSPNYVEVWSTRALLGSAGSNGLESVPPAAFELHRLERTDSSLMTQGDPLILVDGAKCVGDVIVDVCRARHEGSLSTDKYRLAVLNSRSDERTQAMASTLARHLAFRGPILDWRGPVPDEFDLVGKSVYLRSTSQDRPPEAQ